jgi:amino acid transporter
MTTPKKSLSLFDSTCVIVGIIIGAGIYENAPVVAASMGSPGATLGVWAVGGLIALAGALCFAELASAYPKAGGDYVYLTRAYGRPTGFMFGWAQLAVVRPADITLIAFIFARYASELFAFEHSKIIYAISAIVLLTAINLAGLRGGKWTQNTLTTCTVLGLLAIAAAGLLATGESGPTPPAPAASPDFEPNLELALILVMFTYGGWNEMAYVAGEIKNPQRNIFRGLVAGTVAVIGLYLLIHLAFFSALGFGAVAKSQAVAVDTMETAFPEIASRAIAIIICISALGSINGLILTGSRITYALGQDHAAFKKLGGWNPARSAPVAALVAQAALAIAIAVFAGSFLDTILYAAPVFWGFLILTTLSLPILRLREPDTPRPYRVTGHLLTVIAFTACCVFMLISAATYAWSNQPKGLAVSLIVLGAGSIVYGVCELISRKKSTA